MPFLAFAGVTFVACSTLCVARCQVYSRYLSPNEAQQFLSMKSIGIFTSLMFYCFQDMYVCYSFIDTRTLVYQDYDCAVSSVLVFGVLFSFQFELLSGEEELNSCTNLNQNILQF